MFVLIRKGMIANAKENSLQTKEISIVKSVLEREQDEIEIISNTTNKAIEIISDTINNEIFLAQLIIFQSHALNLLTSLKMKYIQITSVLEQAKLGLPSVLLISHAELREQIRDIKRKHNILSPVFDENEVHFYYSIPIVKMVWTGTLDVYIRIPLVNHGKTYQISPVNKAESGLLAREDYILTSRDGKTFRFLTDAELQKCLQVHSSFITDLRIVESDLHTLKCDHLGCAGKNTNGILEIRELTSESFAYSTSEPFEASLVCDSGHHPVSLPARGFFSLPVDCALTSNLFSIDRYPQEFNQDMKNGVQEFKVQELTDPKDMIDPHAIVKKIEMSKLKRTINQHISDLAKALNESTRIQRTFNQSLDEMTFQLSNMMMMHYCTYGGFGAGFLIIIIVLSCCFCYLCKQLSRKVNA